MSQLRSAFVQSVRTLNLPVAQACRKFNISRQTGYLWLRRFDDEPHTTFADRSRRPRRSPRKSSHELEAAVLAVRDTHHWGARKIRAVLKTQGHAVPSIRTVNTILLRQGRIPPTPQPQPQQPLTRFERSTPNELWQADFLQDLEVARQRVDQLTILDDHSRYLLAMPLVKDRTMATAWDVLWELFGDVGLPEVFLCDNSFGSVHAAPRTITWLQARFIRLGIRITHGRPYHPQTQGKVERLHRSVREEFLPHARLDCLEHFVADGCAWRNTYNTLRPHEAIGDEPPLSRWSPSTRRRPATLPEMHYDQGAELRRVCERGQIRWHKSRIIAGYGLAGEAVRVEDLGHLVNIYYGSTLTRSVPTASLKANALI